MPAPPIIPRRSAVSRHFNKGNHRLYDPSDGRDSVAVRTVPIDEYDGIDPSRAHLIKLDTQGSEVPILRGMKKLLVNHAKEIVLICEFARSDLSETEVARASSSK
jgi:FkbM family methyltransferase